MTLNLILFGIAPLLAFVVIDSFLGLKAGIIAAFLLAITESSYTFIVTGSLDEVSIASLLLVLGFGFFSLKANNPIYMKLQPVFLGLCFAIILLVMQALGQPLMLLIVDKYENLIPDDLKVNFANPLMREILSKTSLFLGVGFLLHAACVAYAAFRMNNWWWLAIRGVGLYVMMFLCIIAARLL